MQPSDLLSCISWDLLVRGCLSCHCALNAAACIGHLSRRKVMSCCWERWFSGGYSTMIFPPCLCTSTAPAALGALVSSQLRELLGNWTRRYLWRAFGYIISKPLSVWQVECLFSTSPLLLSQIRGKKWAILICLFCFLRVQWLTEQKMACPACCNL